jgi:hypothetical protein
MKNDTPSLADRFANTLEGVRAAGTRKGPAAALQAAILKLLEAILALLVQFEAGRLAAAVPAGRGTCAAPTPALPRFAGEGEWSPTSRSRRAGPSRSTPRGREGVLDRGGSAAGADSGAVVPDTGTASAAGLAEAAAAGAANARGRRVPCRVWSSRRRIRSGHRARKARFQKIRG